MITFEEYLFGWCKHMKQKMPVFAGRFITLRRDQTQAEFAEFLGISRPTVGFYESGERIPDAITLEKIARRCNVSADWLLGLSDNPSVEENNQITQKTLGLSPEAVENLAKVARMKRYPNSSSFHTEFGKQVLGTALNCLLSSEALIGIARSIYEFYDASAKIREIENLTVEDLCQMDTNYADYDCAETFKNYRLARLDLNESLLAITNDRMEFLKATQAQRIVDDFYVRLEEAEKLSKQQENQAENEWVKTFAEAEKGSPDYSEREGLDEDYGSDETKGN